MRRVFVLLTLVLLLCGRSAFSQTFRGAINGTVTDPSGAVVPNANVTAIEVATGVRRTTLTTSAGQFSFQDIPPGFYRVEVNARAFSAFAAGKIEVTAGNIYTLPVKLSVAKEATTIEVAAASVSLDTTTQTQSNSIPVDVVQNAPMNGRDFTQFIAIAPGYGGYAVGGFGSMNGARPNQVNWQIDGVDNNDAWHNIPAVNQGGVSGIAGVVLPLDSIDEFSSQTQTSTESGRNAGGSVNLTLKSGTNTLHGSAYFYDRNEAFSASSPFLPSGTRSPKLRNLNYGGTVGGPIIKNRTFFFLAFERQQYIIGLSGLATEPSDAWVNLAKDLLNNPGGKYGSYAPVAVSAASSTAIGASGFWPRNIIGGLPATLKNFFSPQASTGYSFNGNVKLDHNITEKHKLSARFYGGQGNQTAPLGSSPALGTSSSNLKYYFEVAPIHVYNGALVLNSVLTNRLVNQLNFGVNYFNQVFHDFNNSFNTKSMGLYLSPDATDKGKYILGAPQIKIAGFESIGLTPPEGRNDVTFPVQDVLSYNKGPHQMRFGGEYRQTVVNEFYHRRGTGQFSFNGSQGAWSGATGCGAASPTAACTSLTTAGTLSAAEALADFMAGEVATSTIAVGNPERFVTVNAYNLFFQDNWQVFPSLNLNLGIRHEYFGPLHNGDKDLAVFIPGKGLAIQGNGINSIYPSTHNRFGPLLGFAWSPSHLSGVVVRGGFGVHFDQINFNPFLDFRPPITGAQGLQGNPYGPHAVSTFGMKGYQWDAVQAGGKSIFPGVKLCADPLCTGAPGQNVFSVNQNFRTPYIYEYNLQVEKALGSAAVLQVGYVGSNARKLNIVSDINQFGAFPTFGTILQLNSVGTSNYNALQTIFKTRNWHGLSTQIGYTWSHALDEISEYRAVIADDANNIKLDYGNGDYDTRHLFTVTAAYDIPGSSHGPQWLTHGWSLTSIVNFHTGQPYDATRSGVVIGDSGTDPVTGNPAGLSLVGDPFKGISHSFSKANGGLLWINPAAFCMAGVGTCPTGPSIPIPGVTGAALCTPPGCPASALVNLGNLRRNQFYGQGYGAVDFSVIKNIPVHERLSVQLRADMFNLFNRKNLSTYYGTIGTACTPNTKTGVCQNDGAFGYITDTIGDSQGAPGIGPGEPFNMQLAIKIIF